MFIFLLFLFIPLTPFPISFLPLPSSLSVCLSVLSVSLPCLYSPLSVVCTVLVSSLSQFLCLSSSVSSLCSVCLPCLCLSVPFLCLSFLSQFLSLLLSLLSLLSLSLPCLSFSLFLLSPLPVCSVFPVFVYLSLFLLFLCLSVCLSSLSQFVSLPLCPLPLSLCTPPHFFGDQQMCITVWFVAEIGGTDHSKKKLDLIRW